MSALGGKSDAPLQPPANAVSLQEVNKYLRFHPREEITTSPAVLSLVDGFVAANVDAATSPLLLKPAADDLSCIAFQLSKCLSQRKAAPALLLLTAFKVVLRKEANRKRCPDTTLKPLVDALKTPLSMRCAAEACNAVLNLCFEDTNVGRVLDQGGAAPIVRFLSTPDEELQASACGALQSISYDYRGRSIVRDAGAVSSLCGLLDSGSTKVVLRAVGALHNLSSDPLSIPLIRDSGGILPLVALLRRPQAAICGSAAGAIQNLSREPRVRKLISSAGAVMPLVDLLVSSDPTAQICAAGALLNLLGPEVSDSEDPRDPARTGLRKLLADGIALGAISQCLTEKSSPAAVEALGDSAAALTAAAGAKDAGTHGGSGAACSPSPVSRAPPSPVRPPGGGYRPQAPAAAGSAAHTGRAGAGAGAGSGSGSSPPPVPAGASPGSGVAGMTGGLGRSMARSASTMLPSARGDMVGGGGGMLGRGAALGGQPGAQGLSRSRSAADTSARKLLRR